jgi:ammonia channel protein AmtB
MDRASDSQTQGQPTEPLLPEGARDVLLGIVAFLVLLAFAAIYIVVFSCSLDVGALCRSAKLDDPQILSASTGLTGLVGGVVAVALAQQQNGRPTSNGGGSSQGPILSRLPARSWKAVLAVLYSFVYTAFGLAALVVWIFAPDTASDALKALASVALGLLLPIVRSYFIPGQ